MDENKPPRPRIKISNNRVSAIADPQEFMQNESSENAKQIGEMAVSIATHLWIDKHYQIRHQHGDDDGERPGIEPDKVEKLVRKSIPHLVFYSTAVNGFSFLNYKKVPQERPKSIVLKEGDGDDKLNVAIEIYFLEVGKYEITVKTAMCVENFNLYIGQYAIEFQDDTSVLTRKDNKSITEVSEI